MTSGGGSSASSSPSRTGTPSSSRTATPSSSRTHTPSPSHTPSPTSTPKPPSVGEITTFAGDGIQGNSGNGGPATSAQLHFPMGITPVGSSGAAPAGSVIIADQSNNQLRVVSAAGAQPGSIRNYALRSTHARVICIDSLAMLHGYDLSTVCNVVSSLMCAVARDDDMDALPVSCSFSRLQVSSPSLLAPASLALVGIMALLRQRS